ncbi:hypothetical protein SNOG_03262 [Parastagonospora nodorum SN15]|uniref:C2H2-type domain-containing protein n=1 Tax=Phaeosphaeria nodorum (strain SN15 / ATCC MYA-4574 / FGSC 10173) TaxID=321614 RepID=Q0UYA2_PHANO|nr:hypothetical protein SNOG_03262 [Parastagonospora nodorum SN15]EAT89993.1 hypothetical protein SNOG_03262 [Parastagonospora nodorum SN15]
MSSITMISSLSPLLPTPRKRRRPSTLSPTSPSDPVVGHVTAAGKFRCSDTTCADLSFGRQADFRRHYEHAHAAKKMEYFCTVDGCARSQRPAGGGRSKGRSFGSREDKMREHVRTVHEKGVGKRRKVDEEDGESEGWVEEM